MTSTAFVDVEAQSGAATPLLNEDEEVTEHRDGSENLLERVNERVEELRSYRSICVLCLLSPVLLPILCWLFGCNAVFACILIFCCGVEFPDQGQAPYEPPTDPREIERLRKYFESTLICRRVLEVIAGEEPAPLDVHALPSLAKLDMSSRVGVTNVAVALSQGVTSTKTKVVFSDELSCVFDGSHDAVGGTTPDSRSRGSRSISSFDTRSKSSHDTRSVKTVRFDEGPTKVITIPSREEMRRDYEDRRSEHHSVPTTITTEKATKETKVETEEILDVPTTITTESPLRDKDKHVHSEIQKLINNPKRMDKKISDSSLETSQLEDFGDESDTSDFMKKPQFKALSAETTASIQRPEETQDNSMTLKISQSNATVVKSSKTSKIEGDIEKAMATRTLEIEDDTEETLDSSVTFRSEGDIGLNVDRARTSKLDEDIEKGLNYTPTKEVEGRMSNTLNKTETSKLKDQMEEATFATESSTLILDTAQTPNRVDTCKLLQQPGQVGQNVASLESENQIIDSFKDDGTYSSPLIEDTSQIPDTKETFKLIGDTQEKTETTESSELIGNIQKKGDTAEASKLIEQSNQIKATADTFKNDDSENDFHIESLNPPLILNSENNELKQKVEDLEKKVEQLANNLDLSRTEPEEPDETTSFIPKKQFPPVKSILKKSPQIMTSWHENLVTCSICLSDYEVGDIVCWSSNEECNHAFHKECIMDWLIRNQNCPCCRLPYVKFPEQQEQ